MAQLSVDHVYDVVIIGAGISGLSAAYLLDKKGIKNTVVLEARDRVGGRTYTVRDAEFGYTDLGGAYVGPIQNRVFRLAKELGLEFYDVDDDGKTVMNIQGGWNTFKGEIPPFWNPIHLLDLNHGMRTIDNMALQVPVDCPWLAEKADVWDKMTVYEFMESLLWTNLCQICIIKSCECVLKNKKVYIQPFITPAKELCNVFIRTNFTSEPHEMSLLFFLWNMHSGHGTRVMSSVKNGAQEKKFVGGAQQLSEKMAEKIECRIHFSSPVILVQEEKQDLLMVKDNLGRTYKAKYVICTVPQAILNRIQFIPTLPPLKQQLIQRVPMCSIIKTIMFYRERFWKKLDFSGSAISDVGPVTYCMDDTKPDGSHPAIMGFVVANKSRELTEMSKTERKQALCSHYASVFKNKEFLEPIQYVEFNWMDEEYSGGCYSAVMPPGVLTGYGKFLRQSFGRVYFAGSETATYWLGYMEGAIQTGEKVANEILCNMGLVTKKEINMQEPESKDFPAITVDRSFIENHLPSVTFVFYLFIALSGLFLALLFNR